MRSTTQVFEQIDEGEILKILSEEDTAANFYKNKDMILSTIY